MLICAYFDFICIFYAHVHIISIFSKILMEIEVFDNFFFKTSIFQAKYLQILQKMKIFDIKKLEKVIKIVQQ